MNNGSTTNEGPPENRFGLSALLKGHTFPPKVPLSKKTASSQSKPEAFGNLEDADKFLKALAGDSPVTFQTFDDKKKDKSLNQIIHGPRAECFKQLVPLNRRGGGVCAMINKGDGRGRSEQNVVAILALGLDLDGSPLDPVLEWTLKPHIVTETSPLHYQCFWKVKDFPLDGALLSEVQGEICAQFGGDPNATKNPCRAWRVPGFFHNKKEPHLSRLMQVNEHPPFSKDDFLKALDIDPKRPKPKQVTSSKTVQGAIPEHHRNVILASLAGTMRRRDFSGEAIDAALQVENTIKCDSPIEPEEVSEIAKSIAKYDPAALPTGKDFHPMPYVQAIIKEFAVIAHEGEFYRYKGGVYEQWPRQEIDQLILRLSFEWARPRHCDEIRKLLETVCYIPYEQVNQAGLLNLKNGILDPKTGQLHEHSPEHYMTTQIPVEWNPQAECPIFDHFLKTVLPEEDQQNLLMQIFGYALTADTQFQKAFILLGGGANGKSVCVNILEALLGPACSAVDLSDLKNQFLVAELRNKTANMSSEINVKDFVQDATLKKIISGDQLVAQMKFKDPFKFRPFAKLIVAANSLPKTYDKSYGYFRRWIILLFEITVPEGKQDRTLSSRIRESELSGVLRKAVDALRRLYKNGEFTIPDSSKKAIIDYEREMNPVLWFFDEHVWKGGTGIYLKDLYGQYKTWCFTTGHQPMSDRNLHIAFEKQFKAKFYRRSGGLFIAGYSCREVKW